ncbi:MAG: GGDEF domain-containing protein [Chloroflexi bacterium]|nr:GGDEF domain-containing protein [Chloroflexota bacterium]
MWDRDRFKELNDRWGHPFGDFVLAETAGLVRANVRESDIVARDGGEELVLLLPETTLDDAALVAEKLRGAVGSHAFRSGDTPQRGAKPTRTTISAGVATAGADLDEDGLIGRADRALYPAKREGRNRVIVDDGDEGDEPGEVP